MTLGGTEVSCPPARGLEAWRPAPSPRWAVKGQQHLWVLLRGALWGVWVKPRHHQTFAPWVLYHHPHPPLSSATAPRDVCSHVLFPASPSVPSRTSCAGCHLPPSLPPGTRTRGFESCFCCRFPVVVRKLLANVSLSFYLKVLRFCYFRFESDYKIVTVNKVTSGNVGREARCFNWGEH